MGRDRQYDQKRYHDSDVVTEETLNPNHGIQPAREKTRAADA